MPKRSATESFPTWRPSSMGSVRHGIPRELVLFLKGISGANVFFETGTLVGETAAWAAEHFDAVETIEARVEIVVQASIKLRPLSNVTVFHGDSKDVLRRPGFTLLIPSIFWLDAHWMGPGSNTAGDDFECPVMGELEAINSSSVEHIVLVDDARLFCSPPPIPHKPSHWPTLEVIVRELSRYGKAVFVSEDVLISVPSRLRAEVVGYLQERTTKAWLNP